MPDFKFLDVKELDFTEAATFRKTAMLAKSNVEVAAERQTIITMVNGVEETTNVEEVGDRIITGAVGERYVLDAKKFESMWEADGDQFKSKNAVRAIVLTEDTEIEAPWGGAQRAKAGGVVVESLVNADRYLIEEEAFGKTFAREEKLVSPSLETDRLKRPKSVKYKALQLERSRAEIRHSMLPRLHTEGTLEAGDNRLGNYFVGHHHPLRDRVPVTILVIRTGWPACRSWRYCGANSAKAHSQCRIR